MKNDLGQREALVLLFCAFPHLGPIHPFVGTSVHAELSCVSQNVRSPSHPSRGYGIGWPYGGSGWCSLPSGGSQGRWLDWQPTRRNHNVDLDRGQQMGLS